MPKTILIVEDDCTISSVIGTFLSTIGHNALTEPDPLKAIADIERLKTVDLVITDNDMPGMQGSDLTVILKRDYPHIKVIFTSGLMPSQAAQAEIPADAFLPKPYRPEILRHTINKVLGISTQSTTTQQGQ